MLTTLFHGQSTRWIWGTTMSLLNRCLGIDFGPASIEYAQKHNPHPSRCEFLLWDIRAVTFGEPYDLVMILYGELNVFSPADALKVLSKAQATPACGGGWHVALKKTVGSSGSARRNCRESFSVRRPSMRSAVSHYRQTGSASRLLGHGPIPAGLVN
jgi:methyltransferase family protein